MTYTKHHSHKISLGTIKYIKKINFNKNKFTINLIKEKTLPLASEVWEKVKQ